MFFKVIAKSTKSCKVASKTAKLAPKPPKLAPRCSQVSHKTPNLASETAQDGPEILHRPLPARGVSGFLGISRDLPRPLYPLIKMSKPRGRCLKNRAPGGGTTMLLWKSFSLLAPWGPPDPPTCSRDTPQTQARWRGWPSGSWIIYYITSLSLSLSLLL